MGARPPLSLMPGERPPAPDRENKRRWRLFEFVVAPLGTTPSRRQSAEHTSYRRGGTDAS